MTGTSWFDTGVTPGQRYYYIVRAEDPGGSYQNGAGKVKGDDIWAATPASGSGGSGGGVPPSFPTPAPRPIDRTYEAGKAIFNGRLQRYRGVGFCVAAIDAGAARKVGRGVLKPFKGGPARALAERLTDCADPVGGE